MNRYDLNVKLKLFVFVCFFCFFTYPTNYTKKQGHKPKPVAEKATVFQTYWVKSLGHLWDILTISLEIFETCTEKFGLLWV